MVIGGSGFIGSRVLEVLTKNNVDVLSYDILNSYSVDEKVKWIRADILELPAIERLFFEYDVDAIIHLVGLPSIDYCEKNPHFSFQLNVLSVQNTLEAMRKTDIKKIVFASSAAVYGYSRKEPIKEMDPTNPNTIYGYHKLIAEEVIRSYSHSYGLNYIALRLFNVYGGNPSMSKDVVSIFARRALKKEPIVVKGPNKFRDFVHVNDVAEAFVKAITTKVSSTAVNVGTGTMITLREIAEIVKEYFQNLDVKYETVQDDGTGLVADITLARNIFNFSPKDPKQGIREYINSPAHECAF